MKVTIYGATSLNGYIARKNDDTSWISDNEWEAWGDIIGKSGHVILGRKTYETMTEDGFDEKCKYYVLTSQNTQDDQYQNVYFKPVDVQAVIADLSSEGIEEVFVIGGAQTNSLFFNAGVVNELIVDIEPLIFSKGINLISEELANDIRLKLIEINKLNESLVQLRYEVLN